MNCMRDLGQGGAMKTEPQEPRTLAAKDLSYKTIVDASPVGIIVFDSDARVIYANSLAEQMFSQSMGAYSGLNCGDFISCEKRHSALKGCGHTADCPACPLYGAIQAALEGKLDDAAMQGETLLNRETGQSALWVKFKTNAIVKDGRPVVVMAIDDITGHKRAEEAYKESLERFRLMFMNAPMPYQSLDSQGNFIDVNQTFLNVLGYSREELIGRNFGDILHPDWKDHFKQNFPRFKAIGEILGVEFELVKKDGSTILVFFNGKIQHDIQGQFKQTHCIFQDITERKRVENALRDSERLLRVAGRLAHIGGWSVDRGGQGGLSGYYRPCSGTGGAGKTAKSTAPCAEDGVGGPPGRRGGA